MHMCFRGVHIDCFRFDFRTVLMVWYQSSKVLLVLDRMTCARRGGCGICCDIFHSVILTLYNSTHQIPFIFFIVCIFFFIK